jgi:two-component system, LytTR family, sensor histidine kinase AlgZ
LHPIFRNRDFLRAYFPGWIPIGLMLAFVLRVSTNLQWIEVVSIIVPLTGILSVVCLSAWYVCRSFDLRTTPDWKLLVTFLPAAMCGSTIMMVFAHLLVWSFGHVFPGLEKRFAPGIPVLAGMFSLAYLLAIVLHYLVLALESSQKAEILSREAELKALKAQVNPHFLFNSLNSISALTSIDPGRARQMCVALSDFLRSSLRLGEQTSIPLGEELALTTSYLDVERVRFGPKLRIRQQLADGCAECSIPPLLVQPLIENAIKHGIATLPEGGEIALSSERRDNHLRLVIENPFDPDAPPAQRTGFGLLGVRNRLHARYGAAGRLEIDVQPALYRVILSVPWSNSEKATS